MSTALTDPRKYRVLLRRIMPVAIQSDAEHRRMLLAADNLLEKGDALTIEEGRMLKLLAVLIEDYERRPELAACMARLTAKPAKLATYG